MKVIYQPTRSHFPKWERILTYHSPLEGESVNQGRSPPFHRWGDGADKKTKLVKNKASERNVGAVREPPVKISKYTRALHEAPLHVNCESLLSIDAVLPSTPSPHRLAYGLPTPPQGGSNYQPTRSQTLFGFGYYHPPKLVGGGAVARQRNCGGCISRSHSPKWERINNHSPLEGESVNQGRSPPFHRWGGGPTKKPKLVKKQSQGEECRGGSRTARKSQQIHAGASRSAPTCEL